MPTICALVPAAGASSRMRGRDKLVLDVDGKPLLQRSVERLLQAGIHRTVVIIGRNQPSRLRALRGLSVEIAHPDGTEPALSRSLQAGYRTIGDSCDAILVFLPDMPDISVDDINSVLASYDRMTPCRAANHAGVPGHPVLVPAGCFHLFDELDGDCGFGVVFRQIGIHVRLVPLPGERAITDLDTPESWQEWLDR